MADFYSSHWWFRTAIPWAKKRLVDDTLTHLTKLHFDLTTERPRTTLLEEDWDILIWLDGCRFDLFNEENDIDGQLDYRYPVSIPTFNFLYDNFYNEDLSDTVYLTAHPMYTKHNLGGNFHAVIDVWQEEWNDKLCTVHPESMANATIRAIEEFPHKRIISHFMQPHYPFIGETAQRKLGTQIGFKPAFEKQQGNEYKKFDRQKKPVWDKLEDGEISKELVWRCYRENLEVTLPHTKSIVEKADGRTVITSDHGNMLGERAWPFPCRVYGHPEIYAEQLMKVPWLVVDKSKRRDIRSGKIRDIQPKDEEIISQRLRDFGYLDQ